MKPDAIKPDAMKPDVILLCEYGSTAHGTNTPESDLDYMGIAIEPIEYVAGLAEFEQIDEKTAGVGNRSGAADTDTTIYSLRKWAKLARSGNPTVLTPLFVDRYVTLTGLGSELLDHRALFVSREAGRRYLGFLQSQRQAMLGLRNKRTNRPELVETHGYDTKFAYHMIRLGLQGIELMQTAGLVLPMTAPDVAVLMQIRRGELSRRDVLALSDDVEERLVDATETSTLPDLADANAIDEVLVRLHEKRWQQTRNGEAETSGA